MVVTPSYFRRRVVGDWPTLGRAVHLADRARLSKVVVKYQNDAGNVPATFVKPLRDGGENRSPGAANLRGFGFLHGNHVGNPHVVSQRAQMTGSDSVFNGP